MRKAELDNINYMNT